MKNRSSSFLKLAALAAAGTLCCFSSGCALVPEVKPCEASQMTASVEIKSEALKSGKFSIGDVSGGQETHWWGTSNIGNPELRKALETTLMNAGAFSQDSGRYVLSVEILNEDYPFCGFDFVGKIEILYSVNDLSKGNHMLEKRVSAEGRPALFAEEPLGYRRLKLCKERAVKANIEFFFEELNRQDLED